jgi:hypothetical protein
MCYKIVDEIILSILYLAVNFINWIIIVIKLIVYILWYYQFFLIIRSIRILINWHSFLDILINSFSELSLITMYVFFFLDLQIINVLNIFNFHTFNFDRRITNLTDSFIRNYGITFNFIAVPSIYLQNTKLIYFAFFKLW